MIALKMLMMICWLARILPLLEKEGWMRRVKRGADGVVSSAKRIGRTDHPALRATPSARFKNQNSDLQDNRQNERPLRRLLIEEFFQVLPNLFFDDSPVAAFFNRCLVDRVEKHLPALRQQALFFNKRDAAENDFGRDFDHAGPLVDRDDEKNDAIFGDMP